jgi:hypothetical protein
MKVELIRLDGDFNFQMQEAIHKINDTGYIDAYNNYSDNDIWSESPTQDRVNKMMSNLIDNHTN